MKKYLSVLMVASRTLWRALAIMVVTALLQTAVFAVAGTTASLEAALGRARVGLIGGAGYAALCVMLCVNTCGFGSRVEYTVARLRIREWAVNLLWAAYHTACVILFWMTQLVTMYLLCRFWLSHTDGGNGQSIAIAVYRHGYLHNLIPGVDTWLWIRNVLLAMASGLGLSYFAMMQRRRRIAILPTAVPVLTASAFMADIYGGFGHVCLMLALALLGVLVVRLVTAAPLAAQGEEATK